LKKLLYLLLGSAFIFVGCSEASKSSNNNEPPQEVQNPVATDDTTEPSEEPSVKEIIAANTCEGLVLKKDEVINGSQLSKCLMDTMLFAKTATYRSDSDDGSYGLIDVQWDPLFSASFHSNEQQLIIKDNEGWIKTPESGWIKESDPNVAPEDVPLQNAIKLARVTMSPAGITQYFTFVNSWTVIEKESVPDEEAFLQTAWHLVPTVDPYKVQDLTISNSHLYLADNFLIAYYESTATIAGHSAKGRNIFTQWGGEINIPEPGM
jgi:hypothetical protein